MKLSLHLAIASTISLPGDRDGNLDQIDRFATRAAGDGADLLLTPELSVTGCGPYDSVMALAEEAGKGPVYERLKGIATRTGVILCAGFIERAGLKRHNSHYAVFPDGSYHVQRKHCVTRWEGPLDPAFSLTWENPEADTGQPEQIHFNTFQVKGVTCAMIICADYHIHRLHQRLPGVECLLVATGGGGQRKDRVTSDELKTAEGRAKYVSILESVFFPRQFVQDALEFDRAFAAVNLCGYDGHDLYHVGHGSIVTPQGEVPALIHGLPNLDRQRPMYTHARVEFQTSSTV